MNQIFVGIDDTDNKDSRGTGFQSRMLAKTIQENNLGEVISISRHQLFVHKDIPYTSQNSSACLLVKCADIERLSKAAEKFLIENAAEGSDVGLAIAKKYQIHNDIVNWGISAKQKVLLKQQAFQLAAKNNVFLKGLTGTHDGVIGALAALGLRKSGNDGRCIWLAGKELRDIYGVYPICELFELVNIENVEDKNGNAINTTEKIFTGNWLRPVIRKNKITIIAEQSENTVKYEWKVAEKSYIKYISD